MTNEAVKKAAAKAAEKGEAPAKAARRLGAKAGRAVEGLVYPVYWRLAGEADPIPGKTLAARRNALAKRRASGVRFEVLAASYGANPAVSRTVSVAEVRRLLAEAGTDPDRSYVGRGTRSSRAGEATRTETRQ